MVQLSLYSYSTLTNRYQTTIPEMVRKALDLKKRDKIMYSFQSDDRVVISRMDQRENDPVLDNFLSFLADDLRSTPENISILNTDLVERIKNLVSDVDVDLNSPLSEEDE